MKLIAQKEAADFVKTGAQGFRQNAEIRITPGAKDIFSDAGIKIIFDAGESEPTAAAASAAAGASAWRHGRDRAIARARR